MPDIDIPLMPQESNIAYVLIVETEIDSHRTGFVPKMYVSTDKQKLLSLMDLLFHTSLIDAASSDEVINVTYEFDRNSDIAYLSYNEDHKLYEIHYTVTTATITQ